MTVAKKPGSCQQRLPAGPIPLRSWATGPFLHPPLPPTSRRCALSLGEMGAPTQWGAGANWLAATHL